MEGSDHEFMLTFPAIRGTQAGREYFVAMVRLSHLARLIPLDGENIPPELRAQRILNRGRIPALARYLVENPKEYVFSAITASVGGEVIFEPLGDDAVGAKLGRVHISADAPVVINDGQHRRAAIERALKDRPQLGRETISVVLFVDSGLKRSQQMFADLNRFPIRPTKSLTILYDHRDPLAALVNRLVDEVPVFLDMTEKAKTTISNRSRKLFTLSSIYQATKRLLDKRDGEAVTPAEEQLAVDFWTAVGDQMPDWLAAVAGEAHPAELRASKIHAHGVALQAIAIAGSDLIRNRPRGWKKQLSRLGSIDWMRDNRDVWNGRALHHGKLSKSQASVQLTANVIKRALGLELSEDDEQLELQL